MRQFFLKYLSFREHVHVYKNRIAKFAQYFKPRQPYLLGVFTDYSDDWIPMGRDLYNDEQYFKKSIDETREILLDLAGTDILSAFKKSSTTIFLTPSQKIFSFTAVQFALYDLFTEYQIHPTSVMGIGFGEVAAVYAAGGITKLEALKIVCREKIIKSNLKEKYTSFKINSGLDDIDPKPLQFDFFAASLKKNISKGTILRECFFSDNRLSDANVCNVLKNLVKTEKKIIAVQFGPDVEFENKISSFLETSKTDIEFYSFFKPPISKTGLFQRIKNQVEKIGRRNFRKNSKTSSFEKFLQNYPCKNDDFFQSPSFYYTYMRQHGSVHFIPDLNGYMVLGYDEVNYALKNPDLFSSQPYSSLEKSLVGADPPAHTQIRSSLQPLFTRKVFKELEVYAQKTACSLVQDFPKEKPFNFVDAFSIPMAKRTAMKFLGISPQEKEEFEKHLPGHPYSSDYYDTLLEFLLYNVSKTDRSDTHGAIQHIQKLTEGGLLSDEDGASLLRLLWLAGIMTSSSLISYSVYRLLQDRDLCMVLKNDPGMINRFIQESVRLETPESYVNRVTRQEVEIGGTTIPENSMVFLNLKSANRDEKYFDEPNQIVLDRKSNKHLSYGAGIHHCIGMPIANLETKEALRVIVDISSKLMLNPEKEISYYPSQHFRALEILETTFSGN